MAREGLLFPMKRFLLTLVLPCLLVILWVVLPLIRGSDTLFLRDVFNTHLGKKWVQAEAMHDGYLPIVDSLRDGGEPHLGNPNSIPLFPDNLLYLVAPTLWAFNAHYWLHLLLAPLTMFWLARVWGLSRESAWAAGVCYVASGFFISNLGFYNLVAGAAWTPAFVAALLQSTRPENPSPRKLLPVGLIWTLLLLAGDPMTCLMALLLGASAVVLRWGWRPSKWVPVGVAVFLGSVIASPQWVEFLRILPLSYRGHRGFSEAAATAASWHPAAVMEWFIPFFFGQPDVTFWGQGFHGGNLPLFPTLYPGVLALVLVIGSGLPHRRAAQWAWAISGLGVLLALGEHNFLVGWLLKVPGTDLLRLPVKFWLMTAVGLALLCGLGFERLVVESHRRAFWRILVGLGVVFLLLWFGFGGVGTEGPSWFATNMAGFAGGDRLVSEQTVWAGWALISLALLAVMGLLYRVGRRSPELTGASLLVLHLALQLWILKPALPMAGVDLLMKPPDLLEVVPESSIVTHGKSNGLFGATRVTLGDYPDARPVWLQRQVIDELYPVAGTIWGRRYDFSISAEGLDAFLTRAAAEALRVLEDEQRVRLLAASGVDVLLLGRALEPGAKDLVRLRHRQVGVGGEIFVYEIDAAPRVLFLGKVLRAPHLNAALDWITAADFDPATTVVLPEGGPVLDGRPGEVKVLRAGTHRMELQVISEGPGVLVIQRAFLPIYRALANGEPVPIVAANIHRLGLELPAGEHRIEIWVDRRPLWASLVLALAALVALVALSWRDDR